MARTGVFVDSNLLVLLVVGRVGRRLITKHRRLHEYTADDYDMLVELLTPFGQVFVTPNTLTETSNLLGQHANPERSRFFDMLRFFIKESEEVVVASVDASSNDVFEQLGLTDAALLQVITAETPLVTVDLDLYLAASRKEAASVINFTHLRRL